MPRYRNARWGLISWLVAGGFAMIATSSCYEPGPPSGAHARLAVEQAIDRFCNCGVWPGECPVQNATLEQQACLDEVYARYPDELWPYAQCVDEALDQSADCLLTPGNECEVCRDEWSLAFASCPQIPMDIRREVDLCF